MTRLSKLVCMKVEVLGARDLSPKDLNGLSDPYCIVLIAGKAVGRTEVISKTLNPTWDAEFSLDGQVIHDIEIETGRPISFHFIEFKVMDQDTLTSDDHEGSCRLWLNGSMESDWKMSDVPNDLGGSDVVYEGWKRLLKPGKGGGGGGAGGRLSVRVTWALADLPPLLPCKKARLLGGRAYAGWGLSEADRAPPAAGPAPPPGAREHALEALAPAHALVPRPGGGGGGGGGGGRGGGGGEGAAGGSLQRGGGGTLLLTDLRLIFVPREENKQAEIGIFLGAVRSLKCSVSAQMASEKRSGGAPPNGGGGGAALLTVQRKDYSEVSFVVPVTPDPWPVRAAAAAAKGQNASGSSREGVKKGGPAPRKPSYALVEGQPGWFHRLVEQVQWLQVECKFPEKMIMTSIPASPYTGPSGGLLTNEAILEAEFQRLGMPNQHWAISDANSDFTFSPTYPSKIVVPARAGRELLEKGAHGRSKARLPVLVWAAPPPPPAGAPAGGGYKMGAVLCRSSQPKSGFGSGNKDDIAYLCCLRDAASPLQENRRGGLLSLRSGPMAVKGTTKGALPSSESRTQLVIFDARPLINAGVNALQGKGFENVKALEQEGGSAEIHFLDIENIHVMRKSLKAAVKAGLGTTTDRARGDTWASINDDTESLVEEDTGGSPDFLGQLTASGWLSHLSQVLKGAIRVAKALHGSSTDRDRASTSTTVLVHCSDGWDRTAQLSALAQVLLDPYYRTRRGFQVLVTKEWFAMGHKFKDRLAINTEETSPIFLQFIDIIWQLTLQFPQAFEFTENYLLWILEAIHSDCFIESLTNSEKDKRDYVALQISQASKIFDHLEDIVQKDDQFVFTNILYAPAHEHNSRSIALLQPWADPEGMQFWRRQHMKHTPVATRAAREDLLQQALLRALTFRPGRQVSSPQQQTKEGGASSQDLLAPSSSVGLSPSASKPRMYYASPINR